MTFGAEYTRATYGLVTAYTVKRIDQINKISEIGFYMS